jgi:hypothetical protein
MLTIKQILKDIQINTQITNKRCSINWHSKECYLYIRPQLLQKKNWKKIGTYNITHDTCKKDTYFLTLDGKIEHLKLLKTKVASICNNILQKHGPTLSP